MPRELKGRNNMNSFDLFLERSFYKLTAFGEDPNTLPPGIKNFWNSSNIMYGKVNTNLVPVSPFESRLLPIPNRLSESKGEIYALDFVVEAFSDFAEFFDNAFKMGQVISHPFLTAPKAYAAFEDANAAYTDHLSGIFRKFNNSYLQKNANQEKVRGIKEYTQLFFEFFLNEMGDTPLTKSSFYLSPILSNRAGGLTIEIAKLDPSQDEAKQKIFIDSPNFEFYRKAAINSGFLIDKNIPWRLNIDLSSPITKKRISSKINLFSSTEDVFRNYFTKVYPQDLGNIYSSIVEAYNSFIEINNIYTSDKGCLMERKPSTAIELLSNIPNAFFLKKYIQIKNMENGFFYNEKELDRMFQIYYNINQSSGSGSALQFLNTKFNIPYVHEGSLVYEQLRAYFKENVNFSLDNLDEHVKMIVKRSSNTIY